MADNSMALNDTLMQLGGEDFLRDLTEFMLNRIMDADVTARINADRHERTEDRETYRNGYRDRGDTLVAAAVSGALVRVVCREIVMVLSPSVCDFRLRIA